MAFTGNVKHWRQNSLVENYEDFKQHNATDADTESIVNHQRHQRRESCCVVPRSQQNPGKLEGEDLRCQPDSAGVRRQ